MERTLTLPLSGITTRDGIHDALSRLLGLPDYYGRNADALYDCVTEQRGAGTLVLTGRASVEAERALRPCLMALRDAGWSVVRSEQEEN